MIHKKITFGLIILSFLVGCTAPTAMLGPAYTLTSTGSVYQASLSYGSNEMLIDDSFFFDDASEFVE